MYPATTEDVSRVLALASEHRVPVTPFGVGTSLEGHVIPVHGGISLDLSRLTGVLEISPGNLTATVSAGVTRLVLERAAGAHGLFFSVDPGADATLGGMAATNAAGTTTVRYGKMRANVLALEAVLPDGRVVRTGSKARKTSAGYDLTGLLIGSEGTLAVITELTLRLHPIPEHAVVLRISFPNVEAACATAAAVVGAGSGVTRVELLDAWTVAAVNAYSGHVVPRGAVPLRRGDRHCRGSRRRSRPRAGDRAVGGRDRDRVRARSRCPRAPLEGPALGRPRRRGQGTGQQGADDRRVRPRDRARRGGALRPPGARTAGPRRRHPRTCRRRQPPHQPPTRPRTIRRRRTARTSSSGEWSTTPSPAAARAPGEHGVGIGKIGALQQEHGDLIPLMAGIKQVFDPLGIMNPGKVLPEVAYTPPQGR